MNTSTMNKSHLNQPNKFSRLAVACTLLMSTSAIVFAQPQAGAGRGLINPFTENLEIAKESVMVGASKMVKAAMPDAKAASVDAKTDSASAEPAAPAVAGPAVIKAPVAPQMKPLAANPAKPPVVDTEGAINPLSGKSYSEEQLMRVLNANKLVTEIGRQQVEQAKNVGELAKAAGDVRQIESAKLRSNGVNLLPKTTIKPVKVDESLSPGEQLMRSTASSPMVTVGGMGGGGMASGTVQIGSEQFTPQSRFDGQQARVTYVDAQPSKAGAGAAQPMGMMPAGFGTNPIPAPMLSPLPEQMPR